MGLRGVLVLFAVALLGVAGAIFFFMPGTPPSSASYTFQDWLVRCQTVKEKLACGLTQQVLDQRSRGTVLQLSLAEGPDGTRVLGTLVPLGVSVPDGVTLQVGEATRKFGYTQCLPGGCIASLKADDEIVAKMKAGGEARLAVVDRMGRPVVMPVSLKGFADAFDKMTSPQGGWWPFG